MININNTHATIYTLYQLGPKCIHGVWRVMSDILGCYSSVGSALFGININLSSTNDF